MKKTLIFAGCYQHAVVAAREINLFPNEWEYIKNSYTLAGKVGAAVVKYPTWPHHIDAHEIDMVLSRVDRFEVIEWDVIKHIEAISELYERRKRLLAGMV